MRQIGVEGVFFRHLRNKHDGILPLHLLLRGAKGFAKKSFDTVSLHCFSVLFPDGNPHRHARRGLDKHRQGRRMMPLSAMKQLLKIRLFF